MTGTLIHVVRGADHSEPDDCTWLIQGEDLSAVCPCLDLRDGNGAILATLHASDGPDGLGVDRGDGELRILLRLSAKRMEALAGRAACSIMLPYQLTDIATSEAIDTGWLAILPEGARV